MKVVENMKNKLYFVLSTGGILVTLLFLFYFSTFCLNDNRLSGVNFCIVFLMITNPIVNLFRVREKMVKSYFYHIFLNLICLYLLCKSIASIITFYVSGGNAANNLFHNVDIVVVLGLLLVLFILSFFLKKEEIEGNKHKLVWLYIGLLFLGIIPLFREMFAISFFTNLFEMSSLDTSLRILLLFLVFLYLLNYARSIYRASELRTKAFIFLLYSFFTGNILTIFGSFYLFIYAEQFLIND